MSNHRVSSLLGLWISVCFWTLGEFGLFTCLWVTQPRLRWRRTTSLLWCKISSSGLPHLLLCACLLPVPPPPVNSSRSLTLCLPPSFPCLPPYRGLWLWGLFQWTVHRWERAHLSPPPPPPPPSLLYACCSLDGSPLGGWGGGKWTCRVHLLRAGLGWGGSGEDDRWLNSSTAVVQSSGTVVLPFFGTLNFHCYILIANIVIESITVLEKRFRTDRYLSFDLMPAFN